MCKFFELQYISTSRIYIYSGNFLLISTNYNWLCNISSSHLVAIANLTSNLSQLRFENLLSIAEKFNLVSSWCSQNHLRADSFIKLYQDFQPCIWVSDCSIRVSQSWVWIISQETVNTVIMCIVLACALHI